ncbi:MAG: TAXI family TRAP transporter solute-binding subunit [Luteitalea sp.]|nr:TAXI family TRAP transporter solute-binding subunit [Luteitalea sp.]
MGKRLSTAIAEFLKVWGLLGLVIAAGFVAAYQYVGAPPPELIRMATGMEDGAYYSFGQRYARLLVADGITLEVIPTAGSVENLELLKRGEVSLALVQGGCATEADREQLQSLGSLFLEPVWVFTRSKTILRRVSELKGTRVAVGATGSGTHLLSTRLLAANGITESNAELIRADTPGAVQSLSDGAVDAAIFVASTEAPFIRSLFEKPNIDLLDMERTTAYGRLFSFLTPVTLSEGVVNLERNIPRRDTRLVATAASLAARKDLNPSLIPALLDAVTRVHESGGVLEQRRQFPSVDFIDLPLDQDARRYIRDGPSFLYRWLPYRTAVLLDRLKLLVLPFVALLIPLFRIGPPLYQWRIRSRIYRWYAAVREIDTMLLSGTTGDEELIRDRLLALEREVASVSVPLAYAGEQYHLRLHVRLLQERLGMFAGEHRETSKPRAE